MLSAMLSENAPSAVVRSRLPIAIDASVAPPTPTSMAMTFSRFTIGEATRTPDMGTGPSSWPTMIVSVTIVT